MTAQAFSPATGMVEALSTDGINAALALFDKIAAKDTGAAEDTVNVTYEFGIAGGRSVTAGGRTGIVLDCEVRIAAGEPAGDAADAVLEVLLDGTVVEGAKACDAEGRITDGVNLTDPVRHMWVPLSGDAVRPVDAVPCDEAGHPPIGFSPPDRTR